MKPLSYQVKRTNKHIVTLFILFSFIISASSLAITSGNKVPEKEMQDIDYTVNIRSSLNDNCTGLLIANQYVITAAHCIDGDNLDNELLLVNNNKEKVVDSSIHSMNVFIGNVNRQKGTMLSSQWIRFHPAYTAQKQGGIKQDYYSKKLQNTLPKNPSDKDRSFLQGDFHGDIAIIKLTDKYLQKNAIPLENQETWKDEASNNALATVRGWGKTESEQTPLLLHETVISYDLESSNHDKKKDFREYDLTWFLTHSQGYPSQGDSGGAIIVNNKVIAFVSNGNKRRINGVGAFQHLEWLSEYINKVNTVGQLDIVIDPVTFISKSWSIPVQPLMLDGADFHPQLLDETGLWSIDGSTCEGHFEMGDICSIQIVFNKDKNNVSQPSQSTLKLNEKTSISLNIHYPEESLSNKLTPMILLVGAILLNI